MQLGQGDGPGDGASGAKVTGGTDVWYTHATLNTTTGVFTLAQASTGLGTDRALGYRVSDNWELEQKFGLRGQITNVFDAAGAPVDGIEVENGNAGASRPKIDMVGTATVLAWEETKGAGGLDEGKFIRYQSFAYNQPPTLLADKAGCLISNPQRSAKRVRFLTQSAAEATGVAAPAVPGRSGVNLAIFWREGLTDIGGDAQRFRAQSGPVVILPIDVKPRLLRPPRVLPRTTSSFAIDALLASDALATTRTSCASRFP